MKPPQALVATHAVPETSVPPGSVSASTRYGDQHWTVLIWARLALRLGGRHRIVERITGVAQWELQKMFAEPRARGTRRKSPGGPPTSVDWFVRENLIVRVHVAHFYTIFDKLRRAGNLPAEALIKAYEKYRNTYDHDARLTFDRAFYLVTHVDGIWTTTEPQLEAMACDACRSVFVTGRGVFAKSSFYCPLCRLDARYKGHVRIGSKFSAQNPIFRATMANSRAA